MARRNPSPFAGPEPDAGPPRPSTRRGTTPSPTKKRASGLGERLRRIALGATAALLTARAFWPSEADYQADAGTGLLWVFALLLVAGLAVASALVGGAFRLRFSWADAAMIAVIALCAFSAGHAVDSRPAINLAWSGGLRHRLPARPQPSAYPG